MYVYHGTMTMMYDSTVYLWPDLGVKYCAGYIVLLQEFHHKVAGGRLVTEYHGGDTALCILPHNLQKFS